MFKNHKRARQEKAESSNKTRHGYPLGEDSANKAQFFMRAILDSSPDCMKILDKKGKLLYLSNGGLEEHGFKTHEEAVGWDWLGSIVKSQHKEALRLFSKCLKGQVVQMDTKHVKGKANREWCNLSLTPIRDEKGKIINILGISRDISERKRDEANIQESQRRMSDIIDFLPDATLVVDLDGKVIAWNRAIEKVTGIKAVDMLGKGNHEYSIPFYGKRRPILVDLALRPDKKFEKKYSSIIRSGDTLTGEGVAHSHFRKGDMHHFSIATALRNPEGKITGAIESIRDVTERKRLELELKKSHDELEIRVEERTADLKKSKDEVEQEKAKTEAYLSSIGEGVIAIDLKGRISLMNVAAEKILGRSFQAAQGKAFERSICLEDEQGRLITLRTDPIAQAIKGRKAIYAVCVFRHKTEGRIPIATTFSPVLSGSKLRGIILTFRDIRREEEFDRAKSEFISLASHQLRTPLTGIKWILQEAQAAKSIDTWKKEYLGDALTSTQRMITLVHNLLNVSRVETGAIAVNSESVNLGDFIAEFLRGEVQLIANEKGQHIHFAKPPRPIVAVIDRQLLRQVVSNLVSNSLRYSPEKSTVGIHLKKRGSKVDLTIADKGIGIRQKDQKHLFEKFFRAQEASKYSTTGSGLGLYIVKQVLKALNGEIRCDSEFGNGSTFTVNLPLKAAIKKSEGNELFEHVIS